MPLTKTLVNTQGENIGLFDKYCEKCGVKVDKKTAPQRFGKYFCSEEHAKEYANEIEKQRKGTSKPQGRHGCC